MERVVGVALIVVGVAVAVGGVILALEPVSYDMAPEFSVFLAAPFFLAAALAVLVGIITLRSGRRR